MSLVPIFENPRTKTVHHFKRIQIGGDEIGLTACGREESTKNLSWTDPAAINCKTCIAAGLHIIKLGRVE
jgi:hypothetical protein